MPTLLLEIGCEELPAASCRDAERQLPEIVEKELGKRPDEVYVGPRRLAVIVRDLPDRTADEWIKGPPLALREKAAAGFARRHGIGVGDLEERDGFLGVHRPGRAIAEVVPERLEAIVRGLSFRKTMRWDDSGLRFPRPVRWRLARLDGETVDGFGGSSWGHRFTHGEIEVPSADDYLETLRAADVEPDAAERRRLIVAGLDALGEWSDPAGKLDEVMHLVEKPTVLRAEFDERFLELPERVVVTTMQSHQRYFPLGGATFAVVINGGDPEVARRGHRQVLEARLEDAAFTFGRDRAKGIEGLAAELGSITFATGAGTYADKAERLVKLVEQLGGSADAVDAARLAKADQAAELVREFPDLQGHIGSVYARLDGFSEEVCSAIEDQYLPDGGDAPLPRTEAGRMLAAADKLDNLVVNFALGNKPTGSRDPFGLRRAAIGLCRFAAEADMTIDLRLAQLPFHWLAWEQGVLDLAGERRPEGSPAPIAPIIIDLPQYVQERMESVLEVPVEFVRAARSADFNDLRRTAQLARALATLDDATMDVLHTAYTRAARLAPEPTEDGDPEEYEHETRLDRTKLEEPAEIELAAALDTASVGIGTALENDEVGAAFAAGAALGPALDLFFEDVLVMAEDPELRRNRRALLHHVSRALGRLGDFSQIPR